MTKYSQGLIDATYQGTFTALNGDQFMWWAHEKCKIVEGGKIRGLVIVTGFTNSQKLSWMNNLIMVLDVDGSVTSQEFKASAAEWR